MTSDQGARKLYFLALSMELHTYAVDIREELLQLLPK